MYKRVLSILLAIVLAFTPVMQVKATESIPGDLPARTEEQIPEEEPGEEVFSALPEETEMPSEVPGESEDVTEAPSEAPEESEDVTEAPSEAPEESEDVTEAPSEAPEESEMPTEEPAEEPEESEMPTEEPAEVPEESEAPTEEPSEAPEESEAPALDGELLEEYQGLSYRDIDIKVDKPTQISPLDDWCYSSTALPARYDGRTSGKVSSVRDQNPYGTCWAFSAVAMAESAFLRLYGTEANLSEAHLVEFFYNAEDDPLTTTTGNITGDYNRNKGDTQEEIGGNSFLTTFALAAWKGVADESVHPSLTYEALLENEEAIIDSRYAFTDKLHLENAYWIPMEDTEGIKHAIMNYGGIGISYYHYYYFADPDGGSAYYCPYAYGTNHAVTIVGWDDNYSVDNFKNRYGYVNGFCPELPSSKGAWLIKNSWGKDFLEDGYFWISYEDASLADTAVLFDFAKAEDFKYNYQYDGSSYNLSAGIKRSKVGAVYTATGKQEIGAVGVAFDRVNVPYKVKIYSGLSNVKNPESGTLLTTQTGLTTYEGFHTIHLDKPAYVGAGEDFSIVIESTDGSNLMVLFDTSSTYLDWIDFVSDSHAGETFEYSNGRWNDALNYYSNAQITLRIKAFANDANTIRPTMVSAIEDCEYTGEAVCPSVTVKIGKTALTEGTDYTVTYQNNINVGVATAVIKGVGEYNGTAEVKFNIKPKALADSMVTAPNKNYDGKAYSDATVSVSGYEITYYEKKSPRGDAIPAPVNAGTYILVVKGTGNYKGSVEKTFKILPLSIEEAQITVPDMIYNKNSYTGMSVSLLGSVADSKNYSVKYYKNQTPLGSALTKVPTNAGNYVAVITGKGNLTGTKNIPFAITPFVLTAENISAPDVDYSGTAYNKVEVSALSGILGDTAYSVKYYADEEPRGAALTKAPANAGNYIAEITGKGNYAGTVEKAFGIRHITLTDEMVTAADMIYSGSAYQGPVVTVGGAGLKEFTDYIVEYYAEQNSAERLSEVPADAGKYIAVVTGNGNYAGYVEKTFSITPYPLADNAVTISDKGYDGQPFTSYSVKALNRTLTEADYKVTYYAKEPAVAALAGAPVDSGSYIAVFEGRGNFAGTIEKEFAINKVSVSKAQVILLYGADDVVSGIQVSLNGRELTAGDYTYGFFAKATDEALAEAPTKIGDYYVKVTGQGNYEGEKIVEFSIHPEWLSASWFAFEDVVFDGTEKNPIRVLKDGLGEADFEVSYNKTPVNAGTYTATVKGIGNYEGSIKYTFKINKRPITSADVSEPADSVYNGKVSKPAVTVSIGGVELSKDNYTVTYANNKNANIGKEEEQKAKVIITGKGNLSGSVVKYFTIAPKSMDGLTLSVKNATFSGKEVAPAVTVKDGKTELVKGKDYTVTYVNATDACTDLTKENAPMAVITGIGNYEGGRSKNFKINPFVVKAKELKVQLYNDKNESFDATLDVKAGKQELIYGRDYLVTLKDVASGDVFNGPGLAQVGGKYHLTFKFINNCVGEKASITVKNVVCTADIGDCEVKFIVDGEYVNNISFPYNGKAQKPKVAVLLDGKPLSTKKYSVSYANNKNITSKESPATITVKGLSGYGGSIVKEFGIIPMEVFPAKITVTKQNHTYTGKEIKPKVTIEDAYGESLEEGKNKDFWIVGYENNVDVNHEGDAMPTVIIRLSENYVSNTERTIKRTFNIKQAKITSVEAANAYYKGGEAVETKLTVKASKITLSPSDYTAVYENNTAVGTATVTITSDKDSGNFYTATSITKTFKITKESLEKAKVKQVKKPVYTGEVIDFSECYELYDSAGKLIEKSQYTVSPAASIKAGTITVTFKANTGEGTRFIGKKTAKCAVASSYLGDFLTMTEKGLPEKKYNKGKAVTLTKKELDAAFKDKVSGQAIKSNSFTVKYENNKKRGMAKAYLTGKGNYNGTVVVYFRIK